MWVSFGVSLSAYLLTIGLFSNLLDIYFIFTTKTFFKIPLISLIAWAPFFIVAKIKKYCFPEAIEKLNKAKSLELKTELLEENNLD